MLRLSLALMILSASLATSVRAADETTTYSDGNISFAYPKAWSKNVKDRPGYTGVTVRNGKTTQVMTQVYKVPVKPEMMMNLLTKAFTARFKDKLIKAKEKDVERTLFGKNRKGRYLAVNVAGKVRSKIELFTLALPKSKKTFVVMFQHNPQDRKAKTQFEAIAKSLKEK